MKFFLNKIAGYVLIGIIFLYTTNIYAQNNSKMNEISATDLYNEFYNDNEAALTKYGMKTVYISGVSVKVGPDVYGLPSVEVAGSANESCKVLCVLPFTDYLKLRHVSRKDSVVLQGQVRGFSREYDLVVVKQCKIITVNGKKP